MIAGATAVDMAEIAATNAKKIAAARCELIPSLYSNISRSLQLIGASSPVLGSSAHPVHDSLADLMIGFYAKRRFAKMTARPDKLTETPHLDAGRGL